MVIHSATHQCSSPDLETCPASTLPEFAFIGRSNVGKSSLINALTRVQGLAKVSSTPGKTKMINFFTINKKWSLVDLPGYGYAKVGKKDRTKFSLVVAQYLKHRPNLQCTFVLIDSRLTPQQIDLDFLHWMVGRGLPLALIFTKADKLSGSAAQANIDAFLLRLQEIAGEPPLVLLSSSKDGTGRREILGLIADAIADESTAPGSRHS
jgi:GTP-binding protein